MKRFIGLLLCGLASSVLAAEGDEEEPTVYVELPTGLSHKLGLDAGGKLTARLPVTVATEGTDLSTLTVKLFDVQFETTRPTSATTAFDVRLQLADDQRGDALLIETRAGVALRPGAYALIVHIGPAAKPEAFQSVALVMQKVAPTLSTGTTVVVRHTTGLPGLDEEKAPGKLVLREESRQADLTGIELLAVPDQENSNTTSAQLDLPASPFDIAAGGFLSMDVTPTRAFPFGTSKGKIEVRTPDLANATSIAYEVRTRRHPFWIIGIAVIGVFFGWLTRVFLQRHQEQLAAGIAASAALEQLLHAEKRIKDAGVQAQIQKLSQDLKETLAANKAAETVQKAKDATDGLKTIESKLKTDLEAEVKDVDALSELLRRNWTLAAPVAAYLQSARSRLDDLATAVRDNDLTNAKAIRSSIVATELLRAVDGARAWRGGIGRYVAALAASALPLADVEQESLAGVAGKLAQDPLPPLPAVDLKGAEGELVATHERYYQANDALSQLRDGARRFLEWAFSTLDHLASTDRERLVQLTESQLTSLASKVEAPELAVDEPRKAATLLRDAWLSVLRAHVPGAALEKIKEMLVAGKWSTAIVAAAEKVSSEKGIALDGAALARALQRSHAPPPDVAWQPAGAPPPGRRGAMPLPLQGTPEERAVLQRRIDRVSRMQSIAVAIVFIVGVYYLHIDDWVGTYKEILALLSLAYLTDLTAEGVAKALKP